MTVWATSAIHAALGSFGGDALDDAWHAPFAFQRRAGWRMADGRVLNQHRLC